MRYRCPECTTGVWALLAGHGFCGACAMRATDPISEEFTTNAAANSSRGRVLCTPPPAWESAPLMRASASGRSRSHQHIFDRQLGLRSFPAAPGGSRASNAAARHSHPARVSLGSHQGPWHPCTRAVCPSDQGPARESLLVSATSLPKGWLLRPADPARTLATTPPCPWSLRCRPR